MSSRIGVGPWARVFGSVLVPDESTPEAIRGAELWRAGEVQGLTIEVGLITAQVEGCRVTLTTPRVPARIWAAMASYARNRGALEKAVAGEAQSVQLEHLMTQDWDEPLVPPASAMVRACSCSEGGACEHVAALGYAFAEEIDADPKALLRWRGCTTERQETRFKAPAAAGDPWAGAAPPEVLGGPSRPAGSVPQRLGPSGVRVGEVDIAEVLRTAYAALAP